MKRSCQLVSCLKLKQRNYPTYFGAQIKQFLGTDSVK